MNEHDAPVGQDAIVLKLPWWLKGAVILLLCLGFFQLLAGLFDASTAALINRTQFIHRTHDFYLSVVEQIRHNGPGALSAPLRSPVSALLGLPKPELDRLLLLLAAELYEQRDVTLPLSLLRSVLGLVLCWGALGSLRNRRDGVTALAWACMANIPATLLVLMVVSVHSNRLMQSVGTQAALALTQHSGMPAERATAEMDTLLRLWTSGITGLLSAWVLLLGFLALVLQNRLRSQTAQRE